VLVYPFRLANRTDSVVHISNVRVSCGCTAAQAVKTTLTPGQETAIVAQMDTRRFFHDKTVTIFVQFDQPEFQEVRLTVHANSRSDLAIMPETLAFGRLRRGTQAKATTLVSFVGDEHSQIIKARCDSNYIQVDYEEVRRDAGETSYQITARVRPDAPAGKWFTDVWLTTNNTSMPRIRVPLTVQIEALPPASTISLGLVKAGAHVDRKVILRGAKPFRVTAISGTDGQVRVRDANSESRTVHVLTLRVHATEAGIMERTIRVQTDMGTNGAIEFNTRAHIVP
jgi:hypothetical protein